MTDSSISTPGNAPPIAHRPAWPRRFLGSTGRRVIENSGSLVLAFSTAVAVLRQGLRPLTWRRTVRREFVHQCYRVVRASMVFTLVAGALTGLALVCQLLYWLDLFGQSQLIGRFLNLVLAREVAPVLVGFIVLGRYGSMMLVELGWKKAGGRIHMLDSLGVDPFLALVVPRVLAAAIGTFCLTVAFLVLALGSGFIFGNALRVTALSVTDFLGALLQALGPVEFAIILLKAFFIGFSVGLAACMFGLSERAGMASAERLLPRAFAWSALWIMLISGIFTVLLY